MMWTLWRLNAIKNQSCPIGIKIVPTIGKIDMISKMIAVIMKPISSITFIRSFGIDTFE